MGIRSKQLRVGTFDATVAGRAQLFLIGPETTRSYDPDNGKMIWECDGPARYCAATVAFGKDVIFSTGGHPQKVLLCIKADGSGDITKTHVTWKSDKRVGYVPSPLYHDGLVYAVEDRGRMRCYDAESGEVIWEHRFADPFYSSPLLVGDRIYLFDRAGNGYVLKAGRTFGILAANKLPDGVFATPAICDSRIYLRTLKGLYCIGTK